MKITNTRIDKIDFNEMEDFIEMIKSYDFSESYFSYPFIKNAIREIKVPVPKYVIPKGTILYRGRVHKNGEQFFHRVSDISYIRDCFLIKNFGRANEPCQSIFYCSDNQKTAFNETCTITREDIDKDSELITWGAWEVNEEIEISYILGSPVDQTTNYILNTLTKGFIEFLNGIPQEDQKVILLFHDFISKQFQIESKGHHSLYKISCAFSNWIYEQEFCDYLSDDKKVKESAGIMYRSSIWPTEGMNIALKNKVVDSSLKLTEARRDNIVRTGTFYDGSDTITAISIDLLNDKIVWTDDNKINPCL